MILSLLGRDRPPVVAKLRPGDAAALAEIHATGFERGWDAIEFERMLADPCIIGHAARPGGRGEPLGFAVSRLVVDEAEILTVAVKPTARGRGLGRLILRQHLGLIAGRGARTIFLEVAEDNEPAVRLYRALGFGEVGRRSGYYRRANGQPATAIVMRRSLG
jgi:ribosomal-protein-alanine N-acetyltransferase